MTQRYDDRYSRGEGPREWRDRERQAQGEGQRQREDTGEPSQPYGQREPYNDAVRNPWGGSSSGGPGGDSRYSESQYGQRRSARGPFDRGAGRGESKFGEGPFADTSESPRFFGMGNYGEGGAHFTGGYDQRGSDTGYQRGDYDYDRHAGQSARPGVMQRAFKRGPKGYQRSDERLREDISERLMHADNIDSSDVTITVEAAKVTLEGTVQDRYTKHYIEDLVDACPGVQDIENRIRVSWR